MSELIELVKTDTIAQITLNRPEAYNAFNYELVSQLANQLTALAGESDVRGVVITGKGKAFCAGGDLKWALGYPARPGAAFHTLASQFHLAILEIRRMKKPVVAAVNGVAAGGGGGGGGGGGATDGPSPLLPPQPETSSPSDKTQPTRRNLPIAISPVVVAQG